MLEAEHPKKHAHYTVYFSLTRSHQQDEILFVPLLA